MSTQKIKHFTREWWLFLAENTFYQSVVHKQQNLIISQLSLASWKGLGKLQVIIFYFLRPAIFKIHHKTSSDSLFGAEFTITYATSKNTSSFTWARGHTRHFGLMVFWVAKIWGYILLVILKFLSFRRASFCKRFRKKSEEIKWNLEHSKHYEINNSRQIRIFYVETFRLEFLKLM